MVVFDSGGGIHDVCHFVSVDYESWRIERKTEGWDWISEGFFNEGAVWGGYGVLSGYWILDGWVVMPWAILDVCPILDTEKEWLERRYLYPAMLAKVSLSEWMVQARCSCHSRMPYCAPFDEYENTTLSSIFHYGVLDWSQICYGSDVRNVEFLYVLNTLRRGWCLCTGVCFCCRQTLRVSDNLTFS